MATSIEPQCTASVTSTRRIHPSTPHSHSTTTTLSIIDAFVARFTLCGAIWYFPSTTATLTLSPECLRQSLAQTLTAYPQWAGQLRMTPYNAALPQRKRRHADRFGRLELRYGRGPELDPGVAFVEANIARDMLDAIPGRGAKKEKGKETKVLYICDNILRENALLPPASSLRMASHLSSPDHADPCVAVQVTRFACGGVAIGVQMVHVLADANTLSRFVHDWSAVHASLASNAPLPELSPVFNPKMLDERAAGDLDDAEPDPRILNEAYELPLHRYDWWSSSENCGFGPAACAVPEALSNDPEAQKLAARAERLPWSTYDVRAPVSHTIIHFTSTQLDRIWAAATATATATITASTGEEGTSRSSTNISRHDALTAHIWALIARARGPENNDPATSIHADISIGLRSRLSPPLPSSYLGSPLQMVRTTVPWAVASSPNPSTLPTLATALRASVSKLTPRALAAQIYATAHELAPWRIWQGFLGRTHMMVTSWVHTGLYECGFGTGGTPSYVHPIMPFMDGCVQFIEGAPIDVKEEGQKKWYDDGVDVAIYLEREALSRLREDGGVWL